jgi:hypothetical protein
MFERVGNLAERVATNVSRRAFLGRLGQGAMGLAVVLAGVFASRAQARPTKKCCVCSSPQFGVWCAYAPYGGTAPCPRGCTQVNCHQYAICPQW